MLPYPVLQAARHLAPEEGNLRTGRPLTAQDMDALNTVRGYLGMIHSCTLLVDRALVFRLADAQSTGDLNAAAVAALLDDAKVRALELAPDDTLVVSVPHRLPMAVAAKIRDQVMERTGHGKVLVLDDAAALTRLRTAEQ